VAQGCPQDSCSWSSAPLLLLRDIHSKLLTHYDCKEGCAPSQSQAHVGARGGRSSQTESSHQQEAAPSSFRCSTAPMRHSLCGDRTLSLLLLLSSRHRNRMHTRSSWQPFTDLRHTFAVSCRAEQLRLRTQQRIITTTEDSALRTGMGNWESQEEDAPAGPLV
jgi:hypothetical protein